MTRLELTVRFTDSSKDPLHLDDPLGSKTILHGYRAQMRQYQDLGTSCSNIGRALGCEVFNDSMHPPISVDMALEPVKTQLQQHKTTLRGTQHSGSRLIYMARTSQFWQRRFAPLDVHALTSLKKAKKCKVKGDDLTLELLRRPDVRLYISICGPEWRPVLVGIMRSETKGMDDDQTMEVATIAK